ncbi:MAG: hypothetical protein K0V04_03615, partial [Deltaproteobacteria bacterium]|nr:hypothetical protein [Deltaproteobacteria bacterium]
MVPPADDRELRMLTGVMVPAKQARIPALDDGIFRTGGVEVGTRVDSGAVMFHLDQVGLDEQIVQARRSVSTARRRLARSRELARFADTDASAAERLGTWLPAGDLSRARHGRTLSGIDEEVAAAELEEA